MNISHRHGGSTVSQYLRQELHGIFEATQQSNVPELYAWAQELGGYFKRFQGGALAPWIKSPESGGILDLEARATLAFFEVCPLVAEKLENSAFAFSGRQKPLR